MAVYVDPVFHTPQTKGWRHDAACHLAADDPDELHAFAARLGLRREWAQHGGRRTLHYDLTPDKRAVAVRLGAVEISRREFARRAMRG